MSRQVDTKPHPAPPNRVAYWFLNVACHGAAALSRTAQMRLGAGLGWLMGRVLRFRRAQIQETFARCFPEKSEHERRIMADGMYRHLGRMALECLGFSVQSKEVFQKGVEVVGEEHAHAALARGRGMLVLMGHIGNWELMGLAVAGRMAVPIHAVVRPQHNQTFDTFWRTSREHMGLHLLPAKNSYRECLRALQRGEIVAILLDQNMRRRNGIFVDFFGRAACTTPGLAYLSAQSGAPVVPVYSIRQPDGRHVVQALPPIEPPPNRDEASIHEATQVYTHILESIIRQHPDQWLWLHKRWRTRPEQPIPPSRRAPDQPPVTPR